MDAQLALKDPKRAMGSMDRDPCRSTPRVGDGVPRPLIPVPCVVMAFKCTDSYVMVWVDAETGELHNPTLMVWN